MMTLGRVLEVYRAIVLTVIAATLVALLLRAEKPFDVAIDNRTLSVDVENRSFDVDVQNTVQIEGTVSIDH
ncbi:MAG: hypothetical protein JWO80_6228 [Bryobacterales bacterium]|nr:hypothetical protein [Bryobacterales bacterium]